MSFFQTFFDKFCCGTREKENSLPHEQSIHYNSESPQHVTADQRQPSSPYLTSTEKEISNSKLSRKAIEHLAPRRNRGRDRDCAGRPWTNSEDEALLEVVQRFPEAKWSEIARHLNKRKASECSRRWKQIKPRQTRRLWTHEEDELLAQLVAKMGTNWAMIAVSFEGRTGKQVRDRYLNNVDSSINKSKWTTIEDRIIVENYYRYGPRWSEISKFLLGRPENMVKNRFYAHIRKRMMTDGDYPTELATGEVSSPTPSTQNIHQKRFSWSGPTNTNGDIDVSFPPQRSATQHMELEKISFNQALKPIAELAEEENDISLLLDPPNFLSCQLKLSGSQHQFGETYIPSLLGNDDTVQNRFLHQDSHESISYYLNGAGQQGQQPAELHDQQLESQDFGGLNIVQPTKPYSKSMIELAENGHNKDQNGENKGGNESTDEKSNNEAIHGNYVRSNSPGWPDGGYDQQPSAQPHQNEMVAPNGAEMAHPTNRHEAMQHLYQKEAALRQMLDQIRSELFQIVTPGNPVTQNGVHKDLDHGDQYANGTLQMHEH